MKELEWKRVTIQPVGTANWASAATAGFYKPGMSESITREGLGLFVGTVVLNDNILGCRAGSCDRAPTPYFLSAMSPKCQDSRFKSEAK